MARTGQHHPRPRLPCTMRHAQILEVCAAAVACTRSRTRSSAATKIEAADDFQGRKLANSVRTTWQRADQTLSGRWNGGGGGGGGVVVVVVVLEFLHRLIPRAPPTLHAPHPPPPVDRDVVHTCSFQGSYRTPFCVWCFACSMFDDVPDAQAPPRSAPRGRGRGR